MTDTIQVALDDVAVGREVTVWALEDGYQTWGQGGVVTQLHPDLVIRAAGTDHTFQRDLFPTSRIVMADVPTDPSECLNFGPDCSGEVEWFDPSGRGRAFQRCAAHREQRAASYSSSMEQYAHTSTPPAWFDPTYAGESWDED